MPERPATWPTAVALAAIVALAVGAGLMVSQALAASFSLLLFALAGSAAFLDLLDLAARLYLRRAHGIAADARDYAYRSVPFAAGQDLTPAQRRTHLRPFAIVASIHNAEPFLDEFIETMGRYRERFWIIDDASADQTAVRLAQAGWRCVRSPVNLKKPAALKALLATLPPEIETVLVIDPDIAFRDPVEDGLSRLEHVIFDFQASGMASMCPRIAIREDGLLARFQALEYCMACGLGRGSLGSRSVNSGVSLYRRAALSAALAKHSLSVYAEDLENSLLILSAGESIYYDGRLVIETEGMRSWRRWFSQRVGWFYGLARVYAERFDLIRAIARQSPASAYQFIVYTGLFGLVLHPLKIASLGLLLLGIAKLVDGLLGLHWIPDWQAADPAYFLGVYVKFTLLSVFVLLVSVPRRERRHLVPALPLFFFYFLAHIVPVTVGFINWFTLWLHGRRLYADHYHDDEAAILQRQPGNAA